MPPRPYPLAMQVNANQIKRKIDALPDGLTYQEASERLGWTYFRAREWMVRFGKKVRSARFGMRQKSRDLWKDVDWSMTDTEISRLKGRTRERVGQVRMLLGTEKVGKRGRRPKILVDNGNGS